MRKSKRVTRTIDQRTQTRIENLLESKSRRGEYLGGPHDENRWKFACHIWMGEGPGGEPLNEYEGIEVSAVSEESIKAPGDIPNALWSIGDDFQRRFNAAAERIDREVPLILDEQQERKQIENDRRSMFRSSLWPSVHEIQRSVNEAMGYRFMDVWPAHAGNQPRLFAASLSVHGDGSSGIDLRTAKADIRARLLELSATYARAAAMLD